MGAGALSTLDFAANRPTLTWCDC